jgi:hypothetical protein
VLVILGMVLQIIEKPLIQEPPPPKYQAFWIKDKFLLQIQKASCLQGHRNTMTRETHAFMGTQEQYYCDKSILALTLIYFAASKSKQES